MYLISWIASSADYCLLAMTGCVVNMAKNELPALQGAPEALKGQFIIVSSLSSSLLLPLD